ncbi:MAG: ABC transporter ATP-binding protein [Gammaproteobacteria bacterium]|nr:ABC transporter ATP-binding protein [Gammaproteobacteria bacterium]MDE0366845.1 ABC transporter ATP-binding protein [Gammaproteobacteria bacterium]
MSEPVLSAQGLAKSFHQGDERIDVLNGLNCAVAAGERVAVVGRSGAGKSTLLHILAGLDEPDGGEVRVAGSRITRASAGDRARIRNRHMGFVYQLHHLLPEFTALENVAMPLRLRGAVAVEAREQGLDMLRTVGLANRALHRPAQLSGGERQRVAVARALIGRPDIVLADEPTGNLDKDNARQVFRLMCSLSDETGTAFVLVTHDEHMIESVHRVLKLDNGVLEARK